MIAIDSNVLLRYLLWDDIEQAEKADILINGSDSVLITDVVLVETIWTLKGIRYKLDRSGIIAVINKLFEEKNIFFEDAAVVWQALTDFENVEQFKASRNRKLDFSDALILHKAKKIAQSINDDFKGFYTFDRAAQNLNGSKAP